jgi:hypothetical protein
VKETRVPVEIHRPAASHWQTLSYNVISSTPHLIGIRAQTTAGYILELTDQSQVDKGNNKITELRTILQRESQNS